MKIYIVIGEYQGVVIDVKPFTDESEARDYQKGLAEEYGGMRLDGIGNYTDEESTVTLFERDLE